MQASAGPFPRADAAPTQPQGRSGKHCVASAQKRSTLEVEMGGVWGGEAFPRPFFALAVPAPELMQPQPSLKVLQGSIVWHQNMGGAHWGAKMGGFGVERPFRGHLCTGSANLAPYRIPYTVSKI